MRRASEHTHTHIYTYIYSTLTLGGSYLTFVLIHIEMSPSSCRVTDRATGLLCVDSTREGSGRVAPSSCLVPSGLLAIHKPITWSSAAVVAKVRYLLCNGAASRLGVRKVKIKVGHGGTLDPMAEGVLVLGVGEGTKLLENYLAGTKSYRAGVLLGYETDTLDRTGGLVDSHVITSSVYSNILLNVSMKVI
jgi:tRNA pseudouridine55 synthase